MLPTQCWEQLLCHRHLHKLLALLGSSSMRDCVNGCECGCEEILPLCSSAAASPHPGSSLEVEHWNAQDGVCASRWFPSNSSSSSFTRALHEALTRSLRNGCHVAPAQFVPVKPFCWEFGPWAWGQREGVEQSRRSRLGWAGSSARPSSEPKNRHRAPLRIFIGGSWNFGALSTCGLGK